MGLVMSIIRSFIGIMVNALNYFISSLYMACIFICVGYLLFSIFLKRVVYVRNNFDKVIFVLCSGYIGIILNLTIFDRTYHIDPFESILGDWSFVTLVDGRLKAINSNAIENVLLFLPLAIILFFYFYNKKKQYSWSFYFIIGISFSTIIELCQAFFHRGTFQLCDIFFNTIGLVLGYYICRKCSPKIESKK